MSECKCKKVVIFPEKKYAALQRLKAGESAGSLGGELEVEKSTVGDRKKNRSKIEN